MTISSKPFEPMELVLRIKKLLNPRVNSNKSEKNIILVIFPMSLTLNN